MIYVRLFAVYLSHLVTLMLLCEPRLSWRKAFWAWTGFFVLTLSVAFLPTPLQVSETAPLDRLFWFSLIAHCGFFLLISRGPVLKSIFIFTSYSIYFMFSLALSQLASALWFHSDPLATMCIRCMISAAYILVLVFGFRGSYLRLIGGIEKGWLPMALFSSVSLIVLSLLTGGSFFSGSLVNLTWLSAAFLIITSAFLVIYKMVRLLGGQNEMRHAFNLYDCLQSELDAEKDYVEKAMRIQHDIRHHNSLLMEYLEDGDSEGAKSYLRQYQNSLVQESPRHYCENRPVNALTRILVRRAASAGFSVGLDIMLPDTLPLAPIELAVIFGNLYENALQSCERAGGGFVLVHSLCANRRLLLEIRNTMAARVPNGPFSARGLGLGSVEAIVEKYGGNSSFSVSCGQFISRLTIPLANIRMKE